MTNADSAYEPQVINGDIEPAVELVLLADNGDRVHVVITGFTEKGVVFAAMKKLGEQRMLDLVNQQFEEETTNDT